MRNDLAMPILFCNRLLNQAKLFTGSARSAGKTRQTTVRAMKFTAYLLVITCLQVSARGTAQISLSEKGASLKKVFTVISKQTGFSVLYDESDLQKSRAVNISVRNASLEEVLNIVFNNQPLVYSIVEKTIIVKLKPVATGLQSVAADLPPPIDVSGTITDADGKALEGANVKVRGTNIGTTTNEQGEFTLRGVAENAVLEISYIGFNTKTQAVNGQGVVNISLIREANDLQNVVVIGYGQQKKRDLTGSVSSITSKSFEKQPIIRIEDALKGRAAGVQVQKPNGAPGAGMKIRIRGANSINGSSDPLYVIDGFIGGDIRTLNPNEIASMDVLKDASSTAIFGSRGANGVVIITTKRGQEGTPSVSFDAFYSVDKVSKKFDLLSGAEFMQIANIIDDTLGLTRKFTDEQISDISRTGGTDWQDAILRTGGTQNYQVSFSGTSQKTKYYVSGSVANQQGIVENSLYKRYGLRANLSTSFGKRLDMSLNIYGTYEKSRNNYNYSGRGNVLGSALIFTPNTPIWDDETKDYTRSPAYGPIAANPVFIAKEQIFDANILNLLANTQLTYKIANGLQFTVSGGVSGNNYNNPYLKKSSPGNSISTTEAGYDNGFTWVLQNTNMLSYSKTFGGIHQINASAAYEQQISTSRSSSAWATGFPTISLGYDNISLGATKRVGSGYNQWSIQSYLGRINYTLMDKYLFTATFRTDGSSKFRGDNKYGYFPSGAIAWRASEEEFIKSANIFSDLKLRASYGLTGSQAIGSYNTLNVLVVDQRGYPFNGSDLAIGIGPGTPANPDLKWETTAQTDVGLDFGFLKGRLSGSLDYYHKKTTDLLLSVNIPDYNGGGSLTKNVGSLQNQGVELTINGIIVDNNRLRISSSANISTNKSKVLDLGGADEIFTNGGYDLGTGVSPFILRVGQPLGQLRGLVFQGIWQEKEAAEAALVSRGPGDAKYLNVNGDGEISGADMVRIGNSQPDFTWGWNTTIEYANFDLNILFNGVSGNDVFNYTRWLPMSLNTDAKYPTSKDVLNRWTPTNTSSTIPGFTRTNYTLQQTSQFLENGSFARLSNLTLGYNLPSPLIKRLRVNQARFYVSGQNLFVITKYSGLDPELSSAPTYSDVAQGIDNSAYPAIRTFTFGVRLTF